MSSRAPRAFWICIAASLALHALVLSGVPGMTVSSDPPTPVLTARLLAVEPPPPPPPPAAAPVPKPPPSQPRPSAAPAAPPERARAPEPAALAVDELPAADGATEASEPMPVEPAAEAEAEPPQVVPMPPPVVSADPAPVPEPVPEPVPAVPQTGSITYDVYYGSDRVSIGRSVQTWSISEASYRLTSFSETTGLVGLFKPYQYAYVSEGRVDASGLHPELFSVRRGREGEQQATARFDWNSNELTFGPAASPRKVPLQPGTHDLLSFIYQLARTVLAPGRMQLVVTTGTKVGTYRLEVGQEETLELPLGNVRAIPVRQIPAPGDESIEIWLAPEQRFLPVRIRFLNREGKMTVEQLATRIAADGS